MLQTISRNERAPQTPLETFFVMAKQATIHGYYTSKIGIHQELRYKGNQFLKEFVGCQTEDGKDCPHCGQKHPIDAVASMTIAGIRRTRCRTASKLADRLSTST